MRYPSFFEIYRSRRPEVFCKKGVLRNFAKFTGKHLCQRLFFIKKKTLAQVFSCEFCEISKNTFSYRAPLVAASKFSNSSLLKKFTLIKALFFLINRFCLSRILFFFFDFLILMTTQTTHGLCSFQIKCSIQIVTMMLTLTRVKNSFRALLNFRLSKGGLTRNDLYGTICLSLIRF